MMTARIAGIGAYVPENLITNDDLSKIVDTNDEWIRTLTGIRERRISSGEGTPIWRRRRLSGRLRQQEVAPVADISFPDFVPGPNYPSRCLQQFRRPSGQ